MRRTSIPLATHQFPRSPHIFYTTTFTFTLHSCHITGSVKMVHSLDGYVVQREDGRDERRPRCTNATAYHSKATVPINDDLFLWELRVSMLIHTINFAGAVTLGGAYDRGGAYPVGLQGHDLLQWAVGFQQQRSQRNVLI